MRDRRRECRSYDQEDDSSSTPWRIETGELHEDIRHIHGAIRNVGEDGKDEGAKQGIEGELRS